MQLESRIQTANTTSFEQLQNQKIRTRGFPDQIEEKPTSTKPLIVPLGSKGTPRFRQSRYSNCWEIFMYSNADVPKDRSIPDEAPPENPRAAVDTKDWDVKTWRSCKPCFTLSRTSVNFQQDKEATHPVYIENEAVRTAVIVIKGIQSPLKNPENPSCLYVFCTQSRTLEYLYVPRGEKLAWGPRLPQQTPKLILFPPFNLKPTFHTVERKSCDPVAC